MVIVHTVAQLQEAKKQFSGSIGFVPTMGALHKGHLSLIQQARRENDVVIASVFVNPTQFLEGEDLNSYPRREEADTQICRRANVDILFMPTMIKCMKKTNYVSVPLLLEGLYWRVKNVLGISMGCFRLL